MTVKTLPLGVCAANCYIAIDNCGNCAIFDPADVGAQLYDFVKSQNLTPKAIIITHAHFDHIYGLTELIDKAKTDGIEIPVYIHADEASALSDTSLNLSATLFGCPYTYDGDVTEVKDGDVIDAGNLHFKVLHTPGHTVGCACFIEENDRVIFTGDTLFCGTCGRTDFPGGDAKVLSQSFKKLSDLEGDYRVYPGHEQSTTLEYERQTNPYMP